MDNLDLDNRFYFYGIVNLQKLSLYFTYYLLMLKIYRFNPSQLLLGLLQAERVVINSREMAALFFVHEATRVFHDRLIEYTEKRLFYQLLSKEIENYFQVNLYFKNYFKWLSWAKGLFPESPQLFL